MTRQEARDKGERSMLYLHGGWPRTGTSSLQAALNNSRDELAAAGVIYPNEWQPGNEDGHHLLMMELLEPSPPADTAVRELQPWIGLGDAVVISTEGFTDCLGAERRPGFLAFISSCQSMAPVTWLWTLRRRDEFFTSMYLEHLHGGREEVVDLNEYLDARGGWFHDAIAGMQEVADLVGENVVYARYDSRGTHNEELLHAIGLPPTLLRQIVEKIRTGPRVAARLTHKAAITLMYLDTISAKAGVEISRPALASALRQGRFRFEADTRGELIGGRLRRAIHDEALAVSRELGFAPYVDFFGNDEIPETPPLALDPDLLEERDIRRLASYMESLEMPA